MNRWMFVAGVFALVATQVCAQTFTPAGPDPRSRGGNRADYREPTQVVLYIESITREPADQDAERELATLRSRKATANTQEQIDKTEAQIQRLLNRGRCSLTGRAAVLVDGTGRWNSERASPRYCSGFVQIPPGNTSKVARLEVGDFILIPHASEETEFWTVKAFNEIHRPSWWRSGQNPSPSPSPTPSTPTPSAPVDLPDSSGSGFFITSDGLFVTNYHVIEDHRSISIKTSRGMYRATVIQSDRDNDLAILRAVGTFPALHVHGSFDLKLAQPVSTVGYPNPDMQGSAAKYSEGTIASLTGYADDPTMIQISVPVQPGNSGGPLVDSRGRVVGVVVAQLSKLRVLQETGNIPENVNYAIKGSILLAMLDKMPDWKDRRIPASEAAPPHQMAVAAMVEASSGMVLVER